MVPLIRKHFLFKIALSLQLGQIRNLWESSSVFVCTLFFIHCNVLSDTIASQDYKLQSLQFTLTRNRINLIGFLLIFAGRFGFGKFFSFIKIESHYQGSVVVTLQIQNFCRVGETRAEVQVFKRELYTHIHLD